MSWDDKLWLDRCNRWKVGYDSDVKYRDGKVEQKICIHIYRDGKKID